MGRARRRESNEAVRSLLYFIARLLGDVNAVQLG